MDALLTLLKIDPESMAKAVNTLALLHHGEEMNADYWQREAHKAIAEAAFWREEYQHAEYLTDCCQRRYGEAIDENHQLRSELYRVQDEKYDLRNRLTDNEHWETRYNALKATYLAEHTVKLPWNNDQQLHDYLDAQTGKIAAVIWLREQYGTIPNGTNYPEHVLGLKDAKDMVERVHPEAWSPSVSATS